MLIAHTSPGAHDSIMFKRSLSRGTSIVAALALVGVLSVALVFTQVLLPNTQAGSQTAEAATPMPTARPAAAGSNSAKVTARCSAAKKAAINNGGQSPELNQPFSKNTTESNICIGAVLDQGLVSALEAQKVQNPQLDERAYKCVGEEGKVYMDAKGTGTIISRASATVAEGKCFTKFCDITGVNCSAGSETAGGQTIQAWAANPATAATLSPDMLKGVASLGPADPQTQAALNNAFGQTIDPQIATQQGNVDTAKQKLDDIASNCSFGGTTTDQSCIDATKAAQEDLQKQQQQLADLQKQKADFASSIKNDLPPDPTLDCSSADNANNPRCYPGVTGDKTGGCSPGQVNFGGKCVASKAGDTFTPPAAAPQAPTKSDNSGGGGGIAQALQSMLSGLMKGLGGAGGAATGAACPSDPTAYAAQQQQYQQQLQQYNYQMQQYQYQQQQQQYQAQTTGYVPISQPVAPVAPVACTPTSSSNTCAAAPAQPATGCPAGTTIRPVTSQGSNGATCTTGWQCAASNATTPTAQLSCQPQVADVGMMLTISYGCTNATGSTGSGFNSLGATSGSTTTVLTAPPTGVNKATFGITCINQNLSGQASCDVQVSKPSIVLVANPKVVATSTASTVGWVTSGMSSCVISSPQQADFTATNAGNTSVNGMATTSPITQDTDILLHCVTLGGGTRDATTTIVTTGSNGGEQTGTITVNSSADGSSIARGSINTISWSSANPPSGSKMSLWLYDVRLGSITAIIANELNASSTYAWTLPKATDTCDESTNFVCGTDLIPGRQYGIEADMYTGTPANASYGAQAYSPDVFTITQ